MGSTRRRFTDEYKAQAVELVASTELSLSQIASNIGVHQVTLGNWVRKSRTDHRVSPAGISDETCPEGVRIELERLRAENARLQMELSFAKKVATWFAKAPQ